MNNKIKFSLLSLSVLIPIFLGLLFVVKLNNIEIANIVELNKNQLLQLPYKTKIDLYRGKKLNITYDEKVFSIYINSYYLENNFYYIHINRYINIKNNNFSIQINNGQILLYEFIFQNLF